MFLHPEEAFRCQDSPMGCSRCQVGAAASMERAAQKDRTVIVCYLVGSAASYKDLLFWKLVSFHQLDLFGVTSSPTESSSSDIKPASSLLCECVIEQGSSTFFMSQSK